MRPNFFADKSSLGDAEHTAGDSWTVTSASPLCLAAFTLFNAVRVKRESHSKSFLITVVSWCEKIKTFKLLPYHNVPITLKITLFKVRSSIIFVVLFTYVFFLLNMQFKNKCHKKIFKKYRKLIMLFIIRVLTQKTMIFLHLKDNYSF